MVTLLAELRHEHKGIAEVLDCLDREVRRFEAGAAPDFDILGAGLDYFAGFPDECHHPKEDLIYERLRLRDQHSAKVVGDLQEAHVQLARDLHAFSEIVSAVQQEAEIPRVAIVERARDFISLQTSHMAMEEANFFPAAERALTVDDWLELEASIARGPTSSRTAESEARYDALRQTVLAWDAENRKEP